MNFYPAEEKKIRLSIEPSQPIKEEPHEVQQHIGRGDKRKRKAHATPNSSVPAKVVVPSPPSIPMPQNITHNVDLHLDVIALTPTPSQVIIASTPSNFIFQYQYVVVQISNGSNIHKFSTFVKNESISNVLKNGTIDNPVLMPTFEFVKKVSKLERLYSISYVFAIFYI